MLIKGCSRKMITLSPKSRYFETVYFVLKPGLPKTSERDILREAELLIAGETGTTDEQAPKKRRETDGVLAYFSGAATVGAAVGAIALAARLIL